MGGKNVVEKKKVIYCDWCGKNPKYIAVYSDDSYTDEDLICKDCYEEAYDEE